MTLQILAPPGVEPIALDQAKTFLRVEAETGRALITRTCRETLDDWAVDGRFSPPCVLKLPAPPLQGVIAITVFAADDTSAVWSAGDYFVDTDTDPGRIIARRGSGFPKPGRRAGGIQIDFVAGFGDTPDDVPAALKEAVLRLIGEAYHDRDGPAAPPLPASASTLLSAYRRVRL